MTGSQNDPGQQIHFAGSVSGGNFQFISAQEAHGNTNVNNAGSDEQSLAAAFKHLEALKSALRTDDGSPEQSAHAMNAANIIDDELRKSAPDKGRVGRAIGVLRDAALSTTGLATALGSLETAVSRLLTSR
jgi:hypothetical protein